MTWVTEQFVCAVCALTVAVTAQVMFEISPPDAGPCMRHVLMASATPDLIMDAGAIGEGSNRVVSFGPLLNADVSMARAELPTP